MDSLIFRPTGSTVTSFLSTRAGSVSSRLKLLHEMIRRKFGFVDRVAVALYDSDSNKLKNYVSSNQVEEDPLAGYEFPLAQALSLLESIVKGPRVVNDLSVFSAGHHDHTKRIREHGYHSSYTIPLLFDESFCGFIFLNSYQTGCFTEQVIEELDVYCETIKSVLSQDVSRVKTLQGVLQTVSDLLHFGHESLVERMPRMFAITRLIAESLVDGGKLSFNKEALEHLCRFAAFHDIGKVTIPGSILMKPEVLTKHDFAIMSTHTETGFRIVESILTNLGLQSIKGIEMFGNIVLSHHERMDGSGYPHRLKGKEIPLEARIVAVVDMYDALTSDRPHRKAMSSDQAFDILEKQTRKLDPDCLDALIKNRDKLPV